MHIGPFTVAEVGVVAWAVGQSLVTLGLVVYLVFLARRHVHAQERIANALEAGRGDAPTGAGRRT